MMPSRTAAITLAFSCALLCPTNGATAANAKPNVIVIFTDDHGYADLSCQGYEKDVKTPNLDRFAAEGARFTDGYVIIFCLSLRNVFVCHFVMCHFVMMAKDGALKALKGFEISSDGTRFVPATAEIQGGGRSCFPTKR